MWWCRKEYNRRILSKMFWWRIARVDDKYSGLMNKDDLIKEQFKQALNSTIKAISGEIHPLKEKKI